MGEFSKVKSNMIKYLQSNEFKSREDSQSNKKSVTDLIEMNKKGYITIDSQNGTKKNPIIERAYVLGFMKNKKALEFKKNFIFSGFNCIIVVPVKDENIPPQYDIPLTIEHDKIITHMSSVIPIKYMKFEMKNIGLNTKEDVLMVLCYDTKWGRNASKNNGLYKAIVKYL